MKVDIKNRIDEIGLNSDNAVVIGSGILNALNLRENKDIDVVVPDEKYKELYVNSRFQKKENHGRGVLIDDIFEIVTDWSVLGKSWRFDDLLPHSIIIDGVRYNTIEFLLTVKRKWFVDGDARQKDIDDIKLMEDFF